MLVSGLYRRRKLLLWLWLLCALVLSDRLPYASLQLGYCSSRGYVLLCRLFRPLITQMTTRKQAVIARRYLRQGNVIRQVASPYSLCQRFPYALFNAMVTKILKWSRIQDSFRITPKIESLVVCAMPDISSKFQEKSVYNFLSYLVHTQTDRQTDKQSGKNITSLAEVIKAHQLSTVHLLRFFVKTG